MRRLRLHPGPAADAGVRLRPCRNPLQAAATPLKGHSFRIEQLKARAAPAGARELQPNCIAKSSNEDESINIPKIEFIFYHLVGLDRTLAGDIGPRRSIAIVYDDT